MIQLKRAPGLFLLILLLWLGTASAQTDAGATSKAQDGTPDHGVAHSSHSAKPHSHHHPASSFLEYLAHHSGSGTSAEPISTPSSMLMRSMSSWQLMLHGTVFLTAVQQTGPRGGDKLFSTNWVMGMAQRQLGPGTFSLRAMLSLEPATVTERRYPLLFQSGETAFGRAIADAQHPHDFIMEIAALYDLRVTSSTLLSLYVAPIGDPALGPPAFPHRASASEDPVAPLGHHLQDSTHIASDVITTGVTYKNVRIEGSGFHGAEPDEFRWDIDQGKIDSWSGRATVAIGRDWTGQYSYGYLRSPEALHPLENIRRMTASISYNRLLESGSWANTLIWGRNRTGGSRPQTYNSYLLESTLRFRKENFFWGRLENVDRTSDLLQQTPGGEEHFLARVQAYTLGAGRGFRLIPDAETAVGGQIMLYGTPASLDPIYGRHPMGFAAFVRVRLGSSR